MGDQGEPASLLVLQTPRLGRQALQALVLLGHPLPAAADHRRGEDAQAPRGRAAVLLRPPDHQRRRRRAELPHPSDQSLRPWLPQPRALQDRDLLPPRRPTALPGHPMTHGLSGRAFQVGTHFSTKHRVTSGHLVGEVVATAGLLALIFALARTHRGALTAPAVGAYIGAAYWFTSSTSFATPAVTIGRMFSDTFAGISPGSVPGFVGAQLVGAVVAVGLVGWLYPHIGESADDVVVPYEHHPS